MNDGAHKLGLARTVVRAMLDISDEPSDREPRRFAMTRLRRRSPVGGGPLRRHRTLVLCVLAGLAAALLSVDRISGFPPKLTPRATDIATAHTSMLVEPPAPIALDPNATVYGVEGLLNRAVLLGNVLASPHSRSVLAGLMHTPITNLEVTAPGTAEYPLPNPDVDHTRKVTDVLHYNDQYRVSFEVNSTVPVVDLYASAPSVGAAKHLADASAALLRGYVASAAAASRTPASDKVTLTQLGSAQGGITNPGASLQLAALAFCLGVVAARLLIAVVPRIRRRLMVLTPSATGS
jgi:hypothetical protein